MATRALVTGASGFVGGFLIEHLRAMGDTVLACDVAGSGQRAAGSVGWIAWDLTDAAGVDTGVRGRIETFRPEVVYHLAALSIPADCGEVEPTPRAVAVNVEGTRRVVELAASLDRRPRLLVVSSSHVYGSVAPESPVVTEESPTRPASGYGKTKLAAEQAALAIGCREAIDVIVARAFQHTGPRQSPRMMLPEWASQFAAPSAEPVRVHTLDAHVDLSDVRDVVRAYRLLVERGAASGVYNVGSGVSRRSGDLFELLRQMAGPSRPVVELRPGRKQEPIADISRLAACTGWRPAIPIEQTIADTWAWWRARGET